MGNRYERIKKSEIKLWGINSPITINKWALLKDNVKDVNVLQLELENVTNSVISALELCIECANISHETVEIKEFTYLDLAVSSNAVFGTQVPIQIDNKEAREFSFTVKRVFFKTGDVNEISSKMVEVVKPRNVSEFRELAETFIREVNKKNGRTDVKLKPDFKEDYWYCTCGRINSSDNGMCTACGISQEVLQEISDVRLLKKNHEEFLAQIREAERIKAEEEKKAREVRSKKIKKLILIASLLLVILATIGGVTKYVILPMSAYGKAIQLMSNSEYQNAENMFVTLDDYKDSAEKALLCNILKNEKIKISNDDIQKMLNTNTSIRVIYDTNGGETLEKSIYNKKEEAVKLSEPQYEDNNFVEWQFTSWRYIADEDCVEICLKAIWGNLFYITYELNGGEADNRTEYRKDDKTFELLHPTRTGYSFIGWTGTGLNELTKDVVILEGTSGNKTYTANWEANNYSIFLSYEGIDTKPEKIEIAFDEEVVLPIVEKEGCEFVGWYDETGNKFTDLLYKNEGDVLLFPQWEPIKYAITYYLDGGENSLKNNAEYVISTENIYLQNPTKRGYRFLGWYKDKEYREKISYLEAGMHENIELFAKWELATYTLEADVAGGKVSANINKSFTVNDLPINLPSATKTGYEFLGWYDDAGGKISGSSFDIASDMVITAHWKAIDYAISYHLNGGTNSVDNKDTYNISMKGVALAEPTRIGYEFLGWYSESDYKNKVTKIDAGMYGDISLYAKWEIITYTVEYVLDGGTISGTTKKKFTVNDLPITLPTAEKSDEVFVGWGVGSVEGTAIEKISDCKNYKLYASYMVSGLKFELSSDKTYYMVNSYTGKSSDVVIPAYYKTLPVKEITDRAFVSTEISSVTIPKTVKKIGKHAFSNCKNLRSVKLVQGLEEIGEGSFYKCGDLSTISLPSTLEIIGSSAFSGCDSLEKVELPKGLSKLGGLAFYSCESLEEIILPQSLKKIERNCFSYCKNLKTVILQEGLEYIDDNAFYNCVNLSKIIIPKSVTYISGNEQHYGDAPSFAGCRKLTVYCRVKEKPIGWDDKWNKIRIYSFDKEECDVVWGYTGN